jgi:hypothetical protein
MNDESNFTVDGNERQQQSYYESEDHPATENVKFIRKTKFPAKVLLWLATRESGISEPVFFKAGLAVNKEMYISKCLPVLHVLALFGVCTLHKGYVGPIRRTNN